MNTRAAVLAYRAAVGGLRRAHTLARAVVDGVLLGLARPEVLHAIDAAYYDAEGSYLDEGYNRSGLADWEREAIEAYFPPKGRVAVTAAGGGREVLALLEAGYDAVGFECHPRLRSFAEELLVASGHPHRIHPVPRDRWPTEHGGCWDAAVVGWGSYMLIPGRARRIEFLRSARETLPEGAPLLLSFFARTRSNRYLDVVAAVGSSLRRIRRRPPLELGDAMDPNYVHLFSEEQLVGEARAAGFEVLELRTHPYGAAVLATVGPGAPARQAVGIWQPGAPCPQSDAGSGTRRSPGGSSATRWSSSTSPRPGTTS